MKKKESAKERYSAIQENPSRKERIEALFDNKIIKVTDYRIVYHKLDKYQRLTFSDTGLPDSFHPYKQGYDYSKVLDDFNETANSQKKIEIL
jgi:hypothetical protein